MRAMNARGLPGGRVYSGSPPGSAQGSVAVSARDSLGSARAVAGQVYSGSPPGSSPGSAAVGSAAVNARGSFGSARAVAGQVYSGSPPGSGPGSVAVSLASSSGFLATAPGSAGQINGGSPQSASRNVFTARSQPAGTSAPRSAAGAPGSARMLQQRSTPQQSSALPRTAPALGNTKDSVFLPVDARDTGSFSGSLTAPTASSSGSTAAPAAATPRNIFTAPAKSTGSASTGSLRAWSAAATGGNPPPSSSPLLFGRPPPTSPLLRGSLRLDSSRSAAGGFEQGSTSTSSVRTLSGLDKSQDASSESVDSAVRLRTQEPPEVGTRPCVDRLSTLSAFGMVSSPDDPAVARSWLLNLINNPGICAQVGLFMFKKFCNDGETTLAWPETLILGRHLCRRLGAPPPDEVKLKACYEASDKNFDGVLTAEEFNVFFDLFLRFELACLDEKVRESEPPPPAPEEPRTFRIVNGASQSPRGSSPSPSQGGDAPRQRVNRFIARETPSKPAAPSDGAAASSAGGAFGGASLALFLLMLI